MTIRDKIFQLLSDLNSVLDKYPPDKEEECTRKNSGLLDDFLADYRILCKKHRAIVDISGLDDTPSVCHLDDDYLDRHIKNLKDAGWKIR